jgi:uncharacterized protein (TIRG00374 family)
MAGRRDCRATLILVILRLRSNFSRRFRTTFAETAVLPTNDDTKPPVIPHGVKRGLQLVFVVALTVFFLWLFLHNADMHSVWKILKHISLWWLTIAIVTNMAALVFRTLRWRTLLDPDDPPPFYATFFANSVGYMLSSLLPIRAADFARPALLSRRTSHRFSGALGTVLTERVLDLLSILLLFSYFVVRRHREMTSDPRTATLFNYLIRPAAFVSVALLAALSLLLFGIYFFGPHIRRAHEFLGRFIPSRFRGAWMNFFDGFAATLEITKHRSALSTVLLSTVGVWGCLTGQVYLSALALHLPVPFDASFFITGANTIGLAVPTPGGVGGIHKVCQFVLTRFYGFEIDASVASAVLYHLVGTIPVVVTGLVLFAREGLHWKDVTHADE